MAWLKMRKVQFAVNSSSAEFIAAMKDPVLKKRYGMRVHEMLRTYVTTTTGNFFRRATQTVHPGEAIVLFDIGTLADQFGEALRKLADSSVNLSDDERLLRSWSDLN